MQCGMGLAFVPAQKMENAKRREAKERIEKLESVVTPLLSFSSIVQELVTTIMELVFFQNINA